MEDSESLPIIDPEENGDEFYEKIEAPKFVDLTAPDPYHPGDDCYWFCLRVGKLNIFASLFTGLRLFFGLSVGI